jgi:hypothetical protein
MLTAAPNKDLTNQVASMQHQEVVSLSGPRVYLQVANSGVLLIRAVDVAINLAFEVRQATAVALGLTMNWQRARRAGGRRRYRRCYW